MRLRGGPAPALTLALALVLALALGGAGAGAGASAGCPAECSCSTGAELQADCQVEGASGLLTVRARANEYVNIECGDPSGAGLACTSLPRFELSRNGSLPSLGISYCSQPTDFSCVLRALGAISVGALTLDACPGGVGLRETHVAGLEALRDLTVVGIDGSPLSVSRDALASLPSLRRLVLQEGQGQLEADTFAGPSNVSVLELGGVGLSVLPPAAFKGLRHLRRLLLYRNHIESLSEDTFEGLAELQILDLSSNRLRELPPAALAPLSNLTNLTLEGNPLETLATLTALTHLQEVIISDTQSTLTLAAGALAGLPHLAQVVLRHCGLRVLPADALANSSALRHLDLSLNALTELPEGALRDQRALATLDLSGNLLREIAADALATLTKLIDLKLDDNQLTELPAGLLDGLVSLTSLSLRDNRLHLLPGAALRGAKGLASLDLAGNQLAFGDHQQMEYLSLSPDVSPFSELVELRHLDLSRNRVSAMFTEVPLLLLRLDTLNLSHNLITLIDAEDNNELNFFSETVQVDVRHNRVARVLLRPAQDRPAPETRRALLLDDNPLECDCQLYALARRLHGAAPPPLLPEPRMEADHASCAGPPSLQGMRVKDVPLTDFACDLSEDADRCPAGCFCKVLPHAKALELRCSTMPGHIVDVEADGLRLELHLSTAPPSLAALPSAVRVLRLSGLGLRAVPPGLAPPSLVELDLSNNSLAEAPVHLLELEGNLTLRLAGNPLACDCWHASQVSALQARAGRVLDYAAVACEEGTPLRLVGSDQLCVTWAAALVGGMLAMAGLLAAAAAALLWRYSLEVRVLLYSRGCCTRWLRRREAMLDRDKEYDAFVSFAHEDTDFVVEHLLPGLEGGPKPFKLCVHSRDWVPGEWIPAQIARSVEQSRRTIVVLSRRFLDSIWGRLEFRAAHMSAVAESRSRVIVVLLEEVEAHPDMDAELRAYLATNTYVRWGDAWFWDKLRYALPHREGEALAHGKGREMLAKAALPPPGGGGGLDARLTPEGKIVNAAAIKAAPV